MLIVGKLLLVICTVTGTLSETHYESNGARVIRALNKYSEDPLFEKIEVDYSKPAAIRKIRDNLNKDDAVTNAPSQLKKGNEGNGFQRTAFVESSFPEKIPVTVIYEPEPAPILRNKNKGNSTVVKVKRRKQPKRVQTSSNKNLSETTTATTVEKKILPRTTTAEVITDRNPSTSPSPRTVVPKVFTKRPPEFNPVFKKIRQRDPVVKILNEKNFVFSHSGNFHYSFEGGDGTKVSSEGELKSFDSDRTGEAVVGSVFYKDKDGNDVSLSYTADENGYRPTGAHLPTPPPVPPAIARALKYLATATTPEPVTKPTKTTKEN